MAEVGLGHVAIVGLGVVGGSLAKALTRIGSHVCGFTTSAADGESARRHGIRVAEDLAACVERAAVALIAVPVDAHARAAAAVAAVAPANAVLFHAAGLQRPSALATAARGADVYPADVARRVIGTHPLAGSHRSGFAAADADLFADSVVSIETRADDATRRVAEDLWRAAGARRFEYRTADEHDDLMTWVSHLPQLASTALAAAIASTGIAASALGPGGRDATRLAASPFDLWAGILAGAGPGAAQAAAALERSIASIRAALEAGDVERVGSLWRSARAWRAAAERDAATGPTVAAR